MKKIILDHKHSSRPVYDAIHYLQALQRDPVRKNEYDRLLQQLTLDDAYKKKMYRYSAWNTGRAAGLKFQVKWFADITTDNE